MDLVFKCLVHQFVSSLTESFVFQNKFTAYFKVLCGESLLAWHKKKKKVTFIKQSECLHHLSLLHLTMQCQLYAGVRLPVQFPGKKADNRSLFQNKSCFPCTFKIKAHTLFFFFVYTHLRWHAHTTARVNTVDNIIVHFQHGRRKFDFERTKR